MSIENFCFEWVGVGYFLHHIFGEYIKKTYQTHSPLQTV